MPIRKYIPVAAISLVVFSSFIRASPSLKQYDLNQNIQDTVPLSDDSLSVKFERVVEEVSFPGGEKAWQEYLHKNIDTTIAKKNKAPNGTYTVIVQFIFDREGNTSDVKALTNHGYGMEEEVIRVIKKTGIWMPAKQNGRSVKAYRKESFTFHVEGKKKKKKRTNATN